MPAKDRPSSVTTVERCRLSTEPTSWSRLPSRTSARSGVLVRLAGITLPERRYGRPSERGRRSTYCSPTADRLVTTASVSAGIFAPLSISSSTATPRGARCSDRTRPTRTPRSVTSALVKMPPEVRKTAVTVYARCSSTLPSPT